MVTNIELENFIKLKLPRARITTTHEGKEPNTSIDRYSINVKYNAVQILFLLGSNIVFYLEETPRAILRLQSLISKSEIQNFINKCIDTIDAYLLDKEIPIVQSYARKYLGQEEKIERKKHANYIYYDKFFIVLTPELILIVLKDAKRTVAAFEIENQDLDKIFSRIRHYAEGIRKNQIK